MTVHLRSAPPTIYMSVCGAGYLYPSTIALVDDRTEVDCKRCLELGDQAVTAVSPTMWLDNGDGVLHEISEVFRLKDGGIVVARNGAYREFLEEEVLEDDVPAEA
jgi:hypothetical protein